MISSERSIVVCNVRGISMLYKNCGSTWADHGPSFLIFHADTCCILHAKIHNYFKKQAWGLSANVQLHQTRCMDPQDPSIDRSFDPSEACSSPDVRSSLMIVYYHWYIYYQLLQWSTKKPREMTNSMHFEERCGQPNMMNYKFVHCRRPCSKGSKNVFKQYFGIFPAGRSCVRIACIPFEQANWPDNRFESPSVSTKNSDEILKCI